MAKKISLKNASLEPITLTPKIYEDITYSVKAGNTPENASKLASVPVKIFSDWMARGERCEPEYMAFAIEINRSIAIAEDRNVLRLERMGGSDPKVAEWLIERRNRKEWGNVDRHEVSGPDGGPIEMTVEAVKRIWVESGKWTVPEIREYVAHGTIPEGKSVPKFS